MGAPSQLQQQPRPPAGLCQELNGLGVRNIFPNTLIWPPPTHTAFPTPCSPSAGLVNGPGRQRGRQQTHPLQCQVPGTNGFSCLGNKEGLLLLATWGFGSLTLTLVNSILAEWRTPNDKGPACKVYRWPNWAVTGRPAGFLGKHGSRRVLEGLRSPGPSSEPISASSQFMTFGKLNLSVSLFSHQESKDYNSAFLMGLFVRIK